MIKLELEPEGERHLYIDGKEIGPERSQKVINHSPDGFCWGYGGSGPAQLALAILLELSDRKTATVWYQDFKWEFIAKLPMDKSCELSIDQVNQWIKARIGRYPV